MQITLFEDIFSNLNSNETILIILLVLIYDRIIHYWNNIYYLAFTNFIGTLFHELSHFIMALIFFRIPSSISLIPKENGNINIYGSVSIKIEKLNVINKFPISIAPLFIFPTMIFNDYFYKLYFDFMGKNIYSKFFLLYVIIVLSINAIPSKIDIKNAIGPSLILWAGVIYVYFFVFDLSINLSFLYEIFKESLEFIFNN